MAFIRPIIPAKRPVYQSTIPIPWRLRKNDPASPAFGGDLWWAQCGKKQALFREDDAVWKAWLLAAMFRRKGQVLRAYKCPWCEWWHLGHRDRQEGES